MQIPVSGIDDRVLAKAEKAIVRFPRIHELGVFVQGGFILSAGRSIASSIPSRVGSEELTERIDFEGGNGFLARVMALEIVANIALLGPFESDDAPSETERYQQLCESIEPLAISGSLPTQFGDSAVYIFDRPGKWIKGVATFFGSDDPNIYLQPSAPIENRAAGSPILTESGELIGVVSSFSTLPEGEERIRATVARPLLSLPFWVTSRVFGQRLAQGPERRYIEVDFAPLTRAE